MALFEHKTIYNRTLWFKTPRFLDSHYQHTQNNLIHQDMLERSITKHKSQ